MITHRRRTEDEHVPDTDELPDGLVRLQNALAARATVKAWSEGAELIRLVRAAHEAGWLSQLRDKTTADALVAERGLPVGQVANVLDVLSAAGVTERVGDAFRLTTSFDALADGTTGADLVESLDAVDLLRDEIPLAVTGTGGALSAAQALVVARDWGIGPTEDARHLYSAFYAALPQYRAVLENGGRLLDVGCGIGAAVLSTATLFDAVRAVAIEVVPEVAEVTRARAVAAGVADRVEIRTADARDLTEEAAFDASFWAQPFFDPTARADTLAVIFRALRPGGLLLVQELFPPVSEEDTANVRARLDRLFLEQHNGTFGRTAEALAAEAEAAGFRDTEIVTTPLGRVVLTHRA
jgi:SAM-dependent methyltransferase